MSLSQWHPFRQMDDFFDQYSRMFPTLRHRSTDKLSDMENVVWSPAADISESADEFLIKLELPEVKKEDVEVAVNDGRITISGEKKFEKKEDTDKLHRIETYYGKFSRSFVLPDEVNPDNITAECAEGVLRIRLPKTEAPAPKRISVDIG